MKFNQTPEWILKMAEAEDGCEVGVGSSALPSMLLSAGPFTVHVHGQSNMVTDDARYPQFNHALNHARNLSGWNIKTDIKDESTGKILGTFSPYNESEWEKYCVENGLVVPSKPNEIDPAYLTNPVWDENHQKSILEFVKTNQDDN